MLNQDLSQFTSLDDLISGCFSQSIEIRTESIKILNGFYIIKISPTLLYDKVLEKYNHYSNKSQNTILQLYSLNMIYFTFIANLKFLQAELVNSIYQFLTAQLELFPTLQQYFKAYLKHFNTSNEYNEPNSIIFSPNCRIANENNTDNYLSRFIKFKIKNCSTLFGQEFDLFDLSDMQIAQQLLAFSAIKTYQLTPVEIYHYEILKLRSKELTPNMLCLCYHLNHFVNWMIRKILTCPSREQQFNLLDRLMNIYYLLSGFQCYSESLAISNVFHSIHISIFMNKTHYHKPKYFQKLSKIHLIISQIQCNQIRTFLETNNIFGQRQKDFCYLLPITIVKQTISRIDEVYSLSCGTFRYNIEKVSRIQNAMNNFLDCKSLRFPFKGIKKVQKFIKHIKPVSSIEMNELKNQVLDMNEEFQSSFQ
jgi:hypothetical protein